MSVDKFGRQSSGQSSSVEPGASERYANNNFIRRDGSNDVEGEVSMNNHKLVNLSEPTEAQDAATRGYVKNFTRNNFLKLDGTNTMEGDLNANNHKIINLSDPVDDGDVINKRYLESTNQQFSKETPDYDLGSGGRTSKRWRVRMVFRKWRLYCRTVWYCMPAAGRILRGSICSFDDSDNYSVIQPVIVRVIINGLNTPWDIIKTSQ